MQNEQANAKNKGLKYILHRWDATRNSYMCADDADIVVPNKAFRLPRLYGNGFINTNSKTVFMNSVVYKKNEKDMRQRIQTFVAQSEYDRGISAIAKAASDIK